MLLLASGDARQPSDDVEQVSGDTDTRVDFWGGVQNMYKSSKLKMKILIWKMCIFGGLYCTGWRMKNRPAVS